MSAHKFLFLFEKLSKNLFKEQRFVYIGEAPKGDEAAKREQAEKDRLAAEQAEKTRRDGAEKTAEKADGKAKEVSNPDPIIEELKNLKTQEQFDKFIKERIQKIEGKGLTETQVEEIAKYASVNNPEKNVSILFDEFKDKHLTIDQFSVKTVKIFLANIRGEDDIKKLIEGLKSRPPEFLIQAAVDYPPLLKQTFDSIKGKGKIKDLDKKLISILAEKLTDSDFIELQKELTDKQKGELLSADLTDARKEAVFQNLFKEKSLKDFESSTNENIVKYICKNLTAPNLRILFDNLETNAKNAQENISKLNIETCKIILTAVFSTIEKTEEASIFRGLERFLKKDVVKTLIEDKGLKLEIRERLYRDLIDKDGITLPVKEEPKPKPAADDKPKPAADEPTPAADKPKPAAEQPQSGAIAKADADKPAATTSPEVLFTKGMELKDIIAKMGDDFEFDGKSISWKFKLTVDGKEVISERSFRVSKRFLKELNKPDKEGRLYNTKDKIKLCAYKWLFDKIYKGEMKKAKGVVVQFKESQEFLKAEIARLTKEVEEPTIDKPKAAGTPASSDDTQSGESKSSGKAEKRPAPAAGERPKAGTQAIPVEGAEGTSHGNRRSVDETGKEERKGRREIEGNPTGKPAAVEPLTKEQTKTKIAEFKQKGLEITSGPDTLTKEQTTTLDTSLTDYTDALKNGSDAFEIIAALKTIGTNFSKNFQKPTEIKLTDKKSNVTLIWSASNNTPNNGFEETNTLIDKILTIKSVELGGSSSPAYQEFFDQSRIAETEAKKADADSKKTKEYYAKYKELTSQVYTLDYAIGDMFEEDIAKNWGNFENRRPVENIMGKPPFGVSPNLAGGVATEIISKGRNDRVYFSDIFKSAKKLPGFQAIANEGKISAELLQDGDKILSQYEKLVAEGKSAEANYIFEKIIAPSLKLVDAISRLRFEEKREGIVKEKDALEVAKKSLPESQLAIIDSLQKLLNYSEDPANFWEKFLGWTNGAEKITMANMDGTTFDVDKGMFSKHFDPKAALFILLEKPNLYTVKNGKKEINEAALLAEVNELMQRGYAIKEIQKAKAKGTTSPAEIQAIQAGAKKYEITSLRNASFTEDQTKAFQLGFLSKEIEESENTVEKGLDTYLNSIFAEKPLRAGESKIFKEILKQGGPRDAKKLQEVRTKFAEVQGILKKEVEAMRSGGKSTNLMHGHIQFDQKGNIIGGGIAVPIKLSDGATMIVALGAGEKGVPFGALGFSFKIAGGEGWNVNFNAVIAVKGAFVGASGEHDVGGGFDVEWMAGLSLSWDSIIDVGVGLGAGVSWQRRLLKSDREDAKKEVVKGTGWTKEDLEKWPRMSTDEKLAVLKKSPEWPSIKAIQDALPQYLDDKNLVRAYDSQISELKASADRGAEKPFPSIIPVGLGFGAMVPAIITLVAGGATLPAAALATAIALIAGAKFRLGTVEIFIPHPKEEQRILELATDANVRAKIAEAFAKMKTGEEKVVFEEKTPDIYYRPGSGLGKGIRIENKKTDFSGLRNDIGTYNDALEKGGTEIRLDKKADGKIELAIDNLFNKDKEADKDVEVHIDPNLLTLGLIQDGGKIFLEGKIDDLIITRERFRFSHTQGEGRSSIRDIITIRQSSSLSGKKKIDRSWLQENEQSYLEILMGKEKYKLEKGGGNIGLLQNNIREIKGFATKKDWEKSSEPGSDFAKHFHQFRPEEMKVGNEGKIIDQSKVEGMKKDVEEMHKALGAVAKEAFEKEQPREKFNEKMRTLFIDPDFHEEYGIKFDSTNSAKLGDLTEWLQSYTNKNTEFELQNLTPKELALGENMLRDLWFTTAYRCEGAISKLNLNKELNAKLSKARFKNIRNLDILTVTELKAVCLKRKVTLNDDEAKTIVDAVQKFKEKPLSDKELIKKNQELKKRIELVRDFSSSKYIAEFKRVMSSMSPALSNNNAENLVKEHFLKDMYNGILTELDRKTTPPAILDFRKLGIDEKGEIPTGADLVSGTRFSAGAARVKALSHTLFEKTDKSEAQLYSSGFLKTTTHEYSLNGNGVERDIARILLELASPIAEDKEFLKSSFAIKVLGLGAYRLIAGEKNYKLMTEVANDPSKATDDKHKEAVAQFKGLVTALRKSQHEGKIYETKSAETGSKVTIDMVSDTKIVAGAYTQCTNTSFYVSEKGRAKTTNKERRVIGASEGVTSIADAETDLAMVTFSLSGGVSLKKATPPREGTPEAGGNGETSQEASEPAPAAGGNTKTGTEGGGNSTGNSAPNTGADAGGTGV